MCLDIIVDGDRWQTPEHLYAFGQPMAPQLALDLLHCGLLVLPKPVGL